MTETQRRFFQRAHDRIARLQPDVLAAVLAVFRSVAASFSDAELARLIAAGDVERLVDRIVSDAAFARAVLPLRVELRAATEKAFRWNTPDLPRGGRVNGQIAVMFDPINPRAAQAIRTLETRVITALRTEIRDTVRQRAARGFETGLTPPTIARGVREVIGLAPNQEAAVANFERMLRAGDREALTRLLRDRRFDRTLNAALGEGGTGLTEAQIMRMTTAYRRRMVAFHAETVSRTAVLEGYKIAQRESWQVAMDAGLVTTGRLQKTWRHLPFQLHPRPTHEAMDGETVPFEQPYTNGDRYAGEQDPWNCHCLDQITVARAATAF